MVVPSGETLTFWSALLAWNPKYDLSVPLTIKLRGLLLPVLIPSSTREPVWVTVLIVEPTAAFLTGIASTKS